MFRKRAIVAVVAVVAVASGLTACSAPQNPPVRREPRWVDQETEQLARRACFDCHSNETRWPFYASLPFASASIREHVEEGRHALNFSEWDRRQEEAEDLGEVVREGEMPLSSYLWMHPEARLSAAEKKKLASGLRATVARDPPPGGAGDDDDD